MRYAGANIFTNDTQVQIADNAIVQKKSSTVRVFTTPETKQILSNLPGWIQEYVKWHKRQRHDFFQQQSSNTSNSSNDTTTKFLVVVCQGSGSSCGGLTDRLGSLLYWLRQAERSNRVLLIHWSVGYLLEDFWIPPVGGLNWVMPQNSSTFNSSSCIYNQRKNINLKLSMLNVTEDQVVCVKSRNGLNGEVIKSNFYDKKVTNTARTFSQIYQIMFTPTIYLQNYINDAIASIGLHPGSVYLVAQIRSAYPLSTQKRGVRVCPNMTSHPKLVKSWATNAVQSVIHAYRESNKGKNSSKIIKNPPVYVTSDNPDVVTFLKSIDKKRRNNTNDNNITDNDGKEYKDWPVVIGLEHMPRPQLRSMNTSLPSFDLFPAFLDYWLMAHSQCVSYGIGGFGKFGAYLAGTGCMIRHRSGVNLANYEKLYYSGQE
eukprot:CAMPEP_0194082964 /NCGR_PEP_ID=MMETSP0149-20130528/8336_1 /TAXON_ID=122233 /ORGANISM="Chaetoceros debilis, Strain MM31A-1" /LENGTH=427 /DNA_ID=CAMNT_0038765247 /DNA_START=207 /DNA_END=1490 /DNA_ORIENTATION=-